ncbi:MAG: bifunctional riboflavin kinase/FAD synthetase [Microthrixaceae bacterium]|nr:bifunctional riboflavin kinase/FAD synthetase [Microthrixaceae bacterium]
MEILYDPPDPKTESGTEPDFAADPVVAAGSGGAADSADRPGAIVTIGAYDGVHLGHRTVIAEVIRRARERGDSSVVVTFDRHPAQVIRPDSAPLLLTNLDQKLELLESTGIDKVLVVRFDLERSHETAEDFVREVLVKRLGADEVVVGEDFHFGHQRRGNIALLNEMGAELGFSVLAHKLVGTNGRAARDESQVSSTAIRRALSEGRVIDANKMLGRMHEIRGPVVTGDQRGRTLGFPTANVAVPNEMLMPADGIYAGWIAWGDGGSASRMPAAIYVGKRPTFYGDEAMTLLEVHVLDFNGDLYGADVSVCFDHMVRGDAKFTSVEDLIEQLQTDCDQIRDALAHPGHRW